MSLQTTYTTVRPKKPKYPTPGYANRLTEAHHRFTKDDGDWGFTRFAEFRKLFSVQEGKKRPTVEDESCKLTAYVRVIKDPTGILWHNFLK
jgi:hypothetical protein